jgi:hypothetical protein
MGVAKEEEEKVYAESEYISFLEKVSLETQEGVGKLVLSAIFGKIYCE